MPIQDSSQRTLKTENKKKRDVARNCENDGDAETDC